MTETAKKMRNQRLNGTGETDGNGVGEVPGPRAENIRCWRNGDGRGRRDSAVKQVGDLAGASPAGADCSVGTVVISGGGAGDQADESPEVKVLEGWV